MQFEYYVLNYDCNKRKVEPFNIFNNCWVQEQTEKEIKRYIRNTKNYKYKSFWKDEKELYGFDALVKRIDGIIAGEEWGRYEYEMCVGEKFTPEVHDILKEIDKFNTLEELKEELEKLDKRTARLKGTDCYEQCNKNMPMIVRECIWQYKQQKKAKDGE